MLKSRKKIISFILAWTIFFTYLSLASLLSMFQVALPLGTVDFGYVIIGVLVGPTALLLLIRVSKKPGEPVNSSPQ